MAQKRLVFLVNGLGNFVSHRLPLARALVAQGYELFVILPNEELPKQTEPFGIPVTFLPIHLKRKSMNPITELRTLTQVYHYYRRIKPQVVIHVALKAALYGSLAALFCRRANGFLVKLHDIEGLAKAIQILIEDTSLRERFARASRSKAEQEFADTVVVEKTLTVIAN